MRIDRVTVTGNQLLDFHVIPSAESSTGDLLLCQRDDDPAAPITSTVIKTAIETFAIMTPCPLNFAL